MAATVAPVLRSFGAGEVTPALLGRIDTQPYQTGLRRCENFVTLPQGAAQFRPGFEAVDQSFDTRVRLVPFVYSDDQAYLVAIQETGGLYFYTAAGAMTGASYAVVGARKAAVCKIRLGSNIGNEYVYLEIAGMPELSGHWYRLLYEPESGEHWYRVTTPTMDSIDSTTFGTFTSGTAKVRYRLSHPWAGADLAGLRFVQSADVLTITHQSYPVQELKRTGVGTWTLTSASFWSSLSAPTSVTATVGGPGGGTPKNHQYHATWVRYTGQTSVESSSTNAGTVSHDLTVAGNYVRVQSGATFGDRLLNVYKVQAGMLGFIGQGSDRFDDYNTTPNMAISPPNQGSTLGTAAGDYPRAVTYFQQRRLFAGSINQPQVVWASKTGTESDMMYSIPARDNDSLVFRIAARELHTIQHMVPLSAAVLLFTVGGVWQVSTTTGVLTPTTINAQVRSLTGANEVQPVTSDDTVIYAHNRGGHVGEVRYAESANGFKANDLCDLAPHLFDGYSIVSMALQEVPHTIVWAVRSDGVLLGLTYSPEQKVAAWHQHTTQGGQFESVAVLPHGAEDALYAVVRRTINGKTVRAVERMYGFIPANRGSAFHVDAGMTRSGAPATTIIGLWHLEGQTVSVLTDGAVHPPRVVANGTIVLERPASVVHVGLPLIGRLQTLPPVLEQAEAFGMHLPKNVSQIAFRVYESGGLWAGPTFDALTEFKPRQLEDYGTPPGLRTGEFSVAIDPLWGRDASVCIEQRDPVPLMLLSMSPDVVLGGR